MNDASPNPYQPCDEIDAAFPAAQNSRRFAFVLGLVYPLATLAIVHLIWLLTWWSIGHPPRPYIDQPEYVGATALLVVLYVTFVASPAVFFGSIGVEIAYGGRRKLSEAVRLSRVVLIIVSWASCFVYVRADPLRIIDWLMD